MTRIELAPEIIDDLERILEHRLQHDVENALSRVQDIIRVIDVLEHSPLIGRPVRELTRELIIGRLARGYVALYRYVPEIDTVFVLALRAQREAGYAKGPE